MFYLKKMFHCNKIYIYILKSTARVQSCHPTDGKLELPTVPELARGELGLDHRCLSCPGAVQDPLTSHRVRRGSREKAACYRA